jgi:anti-sigma factor ChrR (cupin superfamily)
MKVLALNRERGYVTLLLDVAPGSRFPPHHHGGDEECYVLSGSLIACGRRIEAGDFHHADAGSDHGELRTDEGCRVLLVVQPEDYIPGFAR